MNASMFEPCPGNSRKVQCVVCGARGYDVDEPSWKTAHLRGHAPCPRCGKLSTVLLNGKPRVHGRCPG